MSRLVVAYAPWKINLHKKRNQVIQPWVLGWRKNHFLHEAYRYVDIDLEKRAKSIQ
jgi:hypothetical protein